MIGLIMPYAGAIDYQSYLGIGYEKEIFLNFSPTPRNNTGWILCDGSVVSMAVFNKLYYCIGYLYGKGERDGEFRVPDYRGYFFRGLAADDHVDKGYKDRQKNPGIGSAGSMQGVGSVQNFMVQQHEHHYINYSGSSGTAQGPGEVPIPGPKPQIFTGADIYPPNSQISTSPYSAEETRSVNIYLNYLIKAR
jgi:microcystin-dependent protein